MKLSIYIHVLNFLIVKKLILNKGTWKWFVSFCRILQVKLLHLTFNQQLKIKLQ